MDRAATLTRGRDQISPATVADPPNKAWFLATVFTILAAGLPIIFFVMTGASNIVPPSVVPVSATILLLATLFLARLLCLGRLYIITAVMWMFIYISGAVVPLAQAHHGIYSQTMDVDYVAAAQVIILVFSLALALGHVLASRRRGPGGAIPMAKRAGVVLDQRLNLLTALAILGSLYYIAKLGGPQIFFGSRWGLAGSLSESGLRTDNSQVGSALVGTIGVLPVFIAWVGWTIRLRQDPETRRPGTWAKWAVLGLLNLVVNNPISNARYWFLAVLIGFVFAMPGFGPRQFRRAIVVGLLAAIVIFPYADYFRTGLMQGLPKTEPIGVKISTKDYDQSTMTANGVWWVDREGHTNGRQLIGAVLFWVPRAMWPEKPVDTGVMIGREMDTINVNLSSPAWLELFIDFGLPGTAVGGLMIGYVARRADDAFIAIRAHSGWVGIPVAGLCLPLISGYMFGLMRGPLLQATGRFAVMIGICVFLGLQRANTPTVEPDRGAAEGRPRVY